MGKVTAIEAADRVIADAARKLERAKLLREALNDPELAADLERTFSGENHDSARETVVTVPRQETQRRVKLPRRNSQPWRILAFFVSHKNEPSQLKHIADGTKLARGAISSILYSQRPDLFIRTTREERSDGFGLIAREVVLFNVRPDIMAEFQLAQQEED